MVRSFRYDILARPCLRLMDQSWEGPGSFEIPAVSYRLTSVKEFNETTDGNGGWSRKFTRTAEDMHLAIFMSAS